MYALSGTDAKHVTDFEFHKCEISSSMPLAPPDPSKVPPLPLSRQQDFVDTRNPHEEEDDAVRIAETDTSVDPYPDTEEDSADEGDDNRKSGSDSRSTPNSNCGEASPPADSVVRSSEGLESTGNSISSDGDSASCSPGGTDSAAPRSAPESTSENTNSEPVDMGEEDDTLKDCFEIYNVENFLSEKMVTTCTAMRCHRYLVADRDRTKCIVVRSLCADGALLCHYDPLFFFAWSFRVQILPDLVCDLETWAAQDYRS